MAISSGVYSKSKRAFDNIDTSNKSQYQQDTWLLARHPKTPGEVVALMARLQETTSLRMWSMYRQWYEEILYYFGEHYLEWDRYHRRFQPTRQPRYIPKPVSNLILPKVMTAVGQLLNVPVSGRVVPNSSQADDLDGADAAEKIRRYNWQRNHMDQKMQDLAFWLVVTGNAWMKSYLETKPKDRVTVMRKIQDKETGKEIEVPQEVRLADVQREVVSPFEIILDWNATDFWEMYWIVQQRVRSIDYIREVYGSKAALQVAPEDNLSLNSWYQYKVRDLLSRAAGKMGIGYSYTIGVGSDLILESSVTLMEWYELPTEEYPDGREYHVAGGVVLHASDENRYKRLPFTQFQYFPLPGSPWNFGLVRNAIDYNRRINGLDAQTDLNRKTMNSSCWLNPKRSGFGSGVANGTPGIIHEYDPAKTFGAKPERILPVGLGPDVSAQRETMTRDMQETTMTQGGILAGEKPAGVTAGVAIKELRNRAREQHLSIRNNFWRGIEDMERLALQITRKAPAWSVPRIAKLLGIDGRWKAEKFKAADMNGNVDFRMESGPRGEETAAARRERLSNLAMMGYIDIADPINRSKFLREMGFEDYNNEFQLDYQMALRENDEIRDGKMIAKPDPESPPDPVTGQPLFFMEIGDFDNDEIHLRVHTDLTKTVEYNETWPEERKLALLLMIDAHRTRLDLAIAEQEAKDAENAANGGDVEGQEEGGSGPQQAKPGAQPPSPPASTRRPEGMKPEDMET